MVYTVGNDDALDKVISKQNRKILRDEYIAKHGQTIRSNAIFLRDLCNVLREWYKSDEWGKQHWRKAGESEIDAFKRHRGVVDDRLSSIHEFNFISQRISNNGAVNFGQARGTNLG